MILSSKLQREHILSLMIQSDTHYYLTGSRRFGNLTIESDYDFFTQYTTTIHNELLQLGFIVQDLQFTYPDNDCVIVGRHPCGIDVQLRKDPLKYENACKLIEALEITPPKDPYERMRFWNALLSY